MGGRYRVIKVKRSVLELRIDVESTFIFAGTFCGRVYDLLLYQSYIVQLDVDSSVLR